MATYNKQQLALLANETGFLRDNLEKVVRLTDILRFFISHELLSQRLILKGGTAINLTVFQMPRLSVDIDLDYCNDCGREEMMSERSVISSVILAYMNTQGYMQTSESKSPHSLDSWVFSYINAGGNRDNIKIEINYSMRCHIFEPEFRHVSVSFVNGLSVRTLNIIELFGSKIKALIERGACRDLYDVANMIDQHIIATNNMPMLRKAVLFYLVVGGSQRPKINYSLHAIQSIQFRHIRASLIPVLRKKDRFDFEEAKSMVTKYVSDLLCFTTQEIHFIEYFNNGKYCPELLFGEEKTILSRIRNHPMAIWKTQDHEKII